MDSPIEPDALDRWFPRDRQAHYVDQLRGQRGLTRRRAECFIRLWGYLVLKTLHPLPKTAVVDLEPLERAVSCTNREAADLFYSESERGSDRAAGMMIDHLVQVGLVEKNFDGSTNMIFIRAVPELRKISAPIAAISLQPDYFNPRIDAVPIATLLAHNYNWMTSSTTAVAHKATRLLRLWAQQYPRGMRVLRRSDTLQAVGFYIVYPIASASEGNLFLPPGLSLHICTDGIVDPMEMAQLGDPHCLSVFVRSWTIEESYKTFESVSLFMQDTQETFVRMQQDFPNISDIYVMPIHPSYEALAQVLGFQKTIQDPHSYLCWMYLAVDRFLELDVERAIARLFNQG
jgi:hypothetical protein